MAEKKDSQKLDNLLLLKRYLGAITLVCVMVTVVASMRIQASVYEITLRASTVAVAILGCQWVLLRTFRAWSLANTRPAKRQAKK